MVYRASIGVIDQTKKNILTASFILAVTIGFPALSAFINNIAEFVPQPTTIAQNDEPGAVLGSNTTGSSSSDTAGNTAQASSANTPAHRQPVTSSRNPNNQPAPQNSLGLVPSNGSSGGTTPSTGGTPTTPPTVTPSDPESGINLEVNVLDTASAEVHVNLAEPSVEANLTVE